MLDHIVTVASEFSRLPDLPVHGVYPTWGPTVLLGVYQLCPEFSGWRKGSPVLFLADFNLPGVEGGLIHLLAYAPVSSWWEKSVPALSLACRASLGGRSGHWLPHEPTKVLWEQGGLIWALF